MTDQMAFNRKTAEVVRSPPYASNTSPWTAVGWLVFTVLLMISPALVWAGWKLLL